MLFLALQGIVAGISGMRRWLILLFSLAFYWLLSSWGILVLLFNGVADFFIARAIGNSKNNNTRRLWLYLSVVLNLGLILCFRHCTQWFSLNQLLFWPAVAGVSFFVFRSLGYVLDVYHENID
jgi:hypothetical protein